MPCPVCTGRLVFRAVTPTKPPSDLEDSTYACERCGTQLDSEWKHCITCGATVKDPYRFV